MPNAQQIIRDKGEPIAALPPSATVLDATRLMNERHIGSVLVMEQHQLVGIFTERDVMRRVVVEGRDPVATSLTEVMTSPVAAATPQTSTDELRKVMRTKRIRHVPVVDGRTVLGMVSIGDLNRIEHVVHEETIRYLEQYISIG